MTFFKNHAGINITGAKLQLVEVDYKESDQSAGNSGFYLENVDEEFFTEFLELSFPETKIINILQNAFNEIILRKPLQTNYISFSLPDNFFKIFQLPVDSKITDSDLREHLKWEVSVLYPDCDQDNFIIRHIENSDASGTNIKHAVVFAAFKKYLKIIHKFGVRNNLILKFADNAHVAADTFLLNKTAVSILLDEKTFSLSVLKNRNLLFFKTFQNNSVADIPLILKDELILSPVVKRGIESNQIYISGNFISEGLIKKLEETTNCKFVPINPFEKLKISATLTTSDFVNKNAHTFTSAAGIALRLI
ncbi:MAG: hypothetical protein F9K45_06510 [Melioribacteraceae bacterium]|nr:MAG: hypothetical protein F9K45_06510 [Melioribacteraceae bacterium]